MNRVAYTLRRLHKAPKYGKIKGGQQSTPSWSAGLARKAHELGKSDSGMQGTTLVMGG